MSILATDYGPHGYDHERDMKLLAQLPHSTAHRILLSFCNGDTALSWRSARLLPYCTWVFETDDPTAEPYAVVNGTRLYRRDMHECSYCSEVYYPGTKASQMDCLYHPGMKPKKTNLSVLPRTANNRGVFATIHPYHISPVYTCCGISDRNNPGCQSRGPHVSIEQRFGKSVSCKKPEATKSENPKPETTKYKPQKDQSQKSPSPSADLDQLHAKLRHMEEELTTTKGLLELQVKNTQWLQRDVKSRDSRITSFEKSITSQDSELAALQKRLQTKDKEIAGLEKRLQAKDDDLQRLQKTVDSRGTEISKLLQKQHKTEHELVRLKQSVFHAPKPGKQPRQARQRPAPPVSMPRNSYPISVQGHGQRQSGAYQGTQPNRHTSGNYPNPSPSPAPYQDQTWEPNAPYWQNEEKSVVPYQPEPSHYDPDGRPIFDREYESVINYQLDDEPYDVWSDMGGGREYSGSSDSGTYNDGPYDGRDSGPYGDGLYDDGPPYDDDTYDAGPHDDGTYDDDAGSNDGDSGGGYGDEYGGDDYGGDDHGGDDYDDGGYDDDYDDGFGGGYSDGDGDVPN